MAQTFRLTVVSNNNEQPFTTNSARRSIGQLINYLTGVIGGNRTGVVSVKGASTLIPALGTLTFAAVTGTVGGIINGVTLTATASDTDDAATAELWKTAINANVTTGPKVNATRSSKVVTLTADNQGTPANSYGLVASGSGTVASGATLANGAYATGTVNFTGGSTGQVGATINGTLVTVAWNTNATTTGDDFVTALELNGTVGGAFSSASNNAGVVTVTITAAVAPSAANAYALVASGTGITVGAALFAGAVAATGTVTFTAVTGTVGATVDGTAVTVTSLNLDDGLSAAAFSTAVNASVNTLIDGHVTASVSGEIVTLTADHAGISGNAITLAASGSGVSASGARLTAGSQVDVFTL